MVSNQISPEKAVLRMKEIHPEYDYTKFEYKGLRDESIVICPKHGEFLTSYGKIVWWKGGCGVCFKERKSCTLEQVIDKFKAVHGDKYIYDKVKYIDNKTKVIVTCPKHGDFQITPSNHKQGNGCSECGNLTIKEKRTKSLAQFIIDAENIHKDEKGAPLYRYSEFSYTKTSAVGKIHCKRCQKSFQQTPQVHLKGCGCPICGRIKSAKAKMKTKERFVEEALRIHTDEYGKCPYSYDTFIYEGVFVKGEIYCKKCECTFETTPQIHLGGSGCPICARQKMRDAHMLSQEEFLRRVQVLHPQYDFSKFKYTGSYNKSTIVCSEHGVWETTPVILYQGYGCPKCSASKGEKRIQTFLDKHQVTYSQEHTFPDCKDINVLPFDFYLSELHMCIEYDGEQHYTAKERFNGMRGLVLTRYHDTLKNHYCSIKNLKLVRIPYWEYKNIDLILQSLLL